MPITIAQDPTDSKYDAAATVMHCMRAGVFMMHEAEQPFAQRCN
jgi:hypothetical protein